jgi:long-chain acyl-CoA synthetase
MTTDGLGDRPWYKDWPVGVQKIVDVPEIGMGELLRETASKHPDNKAIVFLDSVITYRQLDDYVDRFATALHNLGMRKGDVAAVMLPNSHQFVIAFFACQRLGVTVTAINPTYKAMEVKHQLNDSGAKALIVLDSVFEAPGKIMKETGVKHLIGTNIADVCGFSPLKIFLGKLLKKIPTGKMPPETLSFKDLLKTQPNVPEVKVNPAEDLAVLQYTGGTTGTPKGAMLTAKNLVSNVAMGEAWIRGVDPNWGWVGVLPLFHVFAMTCCMNMAVATGGFQLLFPRPPADMKEWAAQIEKWGKGTSMVMAGVAVLFNKINHSDGMEQFDLSPLKKCLSGAGPLPRDVQQTFEKKIGSMVVEGYGLSESSPVVTANPFELPEGSERVWGSIGLPFPNTDAKIMDLETGEKQLGYGEDQVGELCVKGPQVMKGYYKRPEESARALRDGWLYTGDVAYMNDRGWIFIMDRARDLVKHKGYSVFPKEVEDYMFSHPKILEVAVVGLPDPAVGEKLKAFVVTKDEFKGQVTGQEIIDWCKENMTHYKVPANVEFRDELPKTMVGKVLRRVLKEEELAKT